MMRRSYLTVALGLAAVVPADRAVAQIPGVDLFQDPASGSVCDLVNAANAELVVLTETAEEPRQFALVTGSDVTLADSLIDDDLNVFFQGQAFGRIAFLEDGDGLATLWWVDAFDNVVALDPITLLPETTSDRPDDFVDVPCDACQFWDREEDCPDEPEETIITEHPESGTFCEGERVTLFIEAEGRNIESFQWFTGNSSVLVGETDNVLVFSSIDFDDAGSYFCEVIDADGTRTRSDRATIVVEDCPDEVPGAPLCGANIFTLSLVGLLGAWAIRPTWRRKRGFGTRSAGFVTEV
ncbi:MAG: immunoglobulin domain-containing protein [Phycisphaerae bacterium]|nr:MAG: hypothetical protein EDS66_14630 [Planctomycetota bacterium]KAB2948603.1 MAG: immunoglobulin domain-containing protein [Phycisphaerae bacterium]MBE7456053.1 immunoglobulin domain-containing protein [Planctomycetia bacterium]MCK6466286.1 immunoglobulin domain-containing protein [Phycisphaerae bacterium]MCL4717311.1 immunoglobulin domain-containing protein [Phycisphaerae bacterium]